MAAAVPAAAALRLESPGGDGGRKGFDTQGTDVGSERRSGVRHAPLAPGARVAVIGGGSCGVYVCKTLLEAGLAPTVFEASHGVGGVWKSTGRGGVAYDSLRTNSSDVITTAPGLPMQRTTSPFPHCSEIREYVERYTEHFGLRRHIRFSTEVLDVRPAPPAAALAAGCPRWVVRVRRVADDAGLVGDAAYRTAPVPESEEELTFDAVYLCTGQYGEDGVWPTLPGRERFAGTITHSRTYRTAAPYAGKRVVILGLGNSALDIALDTSAVAESVFVAVRRGSTMVVAVDDSIGRPQDIAIHTRFNIYGPKASQAKTQVAAMQVGGERGPLAADTVPDRGDPLEVMRAMIAAGMPRPGPGAKSQLGQVKDRRSVLARLRDGRIRLGAGVKEVRERSVVLNDGREVAADAIICCTGYDLFKSLSFVDDGVLRGVQRLSPSGRQWLDLHKMMLHPQHRNLVFCGMISTDANEALVGEMQARWATAVLTGRVDWPSDAEVREFCRRRAARIADADPAYTRFVRYIAYMDDLARDIGCLPQLPPLPDAWRRGAAYVPTPETSEERYAFNLWFGPTVPSHWRLDGPAAWDAREARPYVLRTLVPGLKTPPPRNPVSWAPPPSASSGRSRL